MGLVHLIAIARRAIVPFLMAAGFSTAGAQDPNPHHHVALIAPASPGNSLKPVYGELREWLPDAEIHCDQTEGRLHITTTTLFSLVELKAHVEPQGYLVLSLNGETHQNTTGRASLTNAGSTGGEPLDDVARAKAAWIEAHPEVYQKMLKDASTEQDAE